MWQAERLGLSHLWSLAWMVALTLAAGAASVAQADLWVTAQPLEVDNCASIWLIARRVDADARFHLIERGTRAESGTPFDLPTAALRRSANRSTFASIAQTYRISDRHVEAIGALVHALEINAWAMGADSRPRRLQEAVAAALAGCADADCMIMRCVAVFDAQPVD